MKSLLKKIGNVDLEVISTEELKSFEYIKYFKFIPVLKSAREQSLFRTEWFAENKLYLIIVLGMALSCCASFFGAAFLWADSNTWIYNLLFVAVSTMVLIPPVLCVTLSKYGPKWYQLSASLSIIALHICYSYFRFYANDFNFERATVITNIALAPLVLVFIFGLLFPYSIISVMAMIIGCIIFELVFGMEFILEEGLLIEFIVHWCEIIGGIFIIMMALLSYENNLLKQWIDKNNLKAENRMLKTFMNKETTSYFKESPYEMAYNTAIRLNEMAVNNEKLSSGTIAKISAEIIIQLARSANHKPDIKNLLRCDTSKVNVQNKEEIFGLFESTLSSHEINVAESETSPGYLDTEYSSRERLSSVLIHHSREHTSLLSGMAPLLGQIPKTSRLDYNIHDFTSPNPLKYISLQIWRNYEFYANLGLCDDIVSDIMTEVAKEYRDLPYHNIYHVADVVQFIDYLLTNFDLVNVLNLSNLEVLALFYAAACHDAGHFGLTNSYLISTKHELARMYCKQSILENFHSSVAMRLLWETDSGRMLMHRLPENDRNSFENMVRDIILATDINMHFTYLEKLSFISSGKLGADGKSCYNKDDSGARYTILCGIIKLADISNIYRPIQVYEKSTKSILHEYFNQGMEERNAKIPVTKIMNFETTDVGDGQKTFSEFLVRPMLKKMMDILTPLGCDLSHLEIIMDQNVNEIKKIKKYDYDPLERKMGRAIPR